MNRSWLLAFDGKIPVWSVAMRALRNVPLLVVVATAAVLIGKWGFGLHDGYLAVGAFVPLLSFFVLSRIMIVLLPNREAYYKMEKQISLKAKWTAGTMCLAAFSASAFEISALIFQSISLGEAAKHAQITALVFVGIFVLCVFQAITVVCIKLSHNFSRVKPRSTESHHHAFWGRVVYVTIKRGMGYTFYKSVIWSMEHTLGFPGDIADRYCEVHDRAAADTEAHRALTSRAS